jgi:hypothetical protein
VAESVHVVRLEDAKGVDESPGVHDHKMAKGSYVSSQPCIGKVKLIARGWNPIVREILGEEPYLESTHSTLHRVAARDLSNYSLYSSSLQPLLFHSHSTLHSAVH